MIDSKLLSHASNLAHKRRIARKADTLARLAQVEQAYGQFLGALGWTSMRRRMAQRPGTSS